MTTETICLSLMVCYFQQVQKCRLIAALAIILLFIEYWSQMPEFIIHSQTIRCAKLTRRMT